MSSVICVLVNCFNCTTCKCTVGWSETLEKEIIFSKRFLIVMKSCQYVRVSSVQNIFDFVFCLLGSTGEESSPYKFNGTHPCSALIFLELNIVNELA